MSDDVGLWRTRLIRLSGSTCVRRSDRALSKIRVFVKCKRHDTNKLDTRSALLQMMSAVVHCFAGFGLVMLADFIEELG